MESKKDIGQAFREKLDQVHKQPGDAVWNSIRGELDKSKPKGMPTWAKLMTAGGLFLLAGFFTYPLWENYVPHIYMVMPDSHSTKPGGETEGNASNNIDSGTHSNTESKSVLNTNEKENSTGNASVVATESVSSETSSGNAISTVDTHSTGSRSGSGTGNNIRGNVRGIDRTTTPDQRASGSRGAAGSTNNSVVSSGSVQSGGTAANSKSSQYENNTAARTTDNNVKSASGTTTNSLAGTIVASQNSRVNPLRANAEDQGSGTGQNNTAAGAGVTSVNTQTDPRYRGYRNNSRGAVPDDTAKDSVAKQQKKAVNDSISRNNDLGEKGADVDGEGSGIQRFSIYGFVAPAEYGLPETGEHLDAGLSENKASSQTALAFGAFLGYNFSGKTSIRVGVIKHKVEQSYNNVRFANTYPAGNPEGAAPANFTSIEYADGITNDMIRQQLGQGTDENTNLFAIAGMQHEFEFLEVPVEFYYNIHGSRFGIGLNGGITTKFLTTNTIYAYNEVGKITLGKMKDIEKVNFGASVGIRFFYEFVPNLQLNVEPTFKYYFKDDEFLQPYNFSVQAGLQYNFDFMRSDK